MVKLSDGPLTIRLEFAVMSFADGLNTKVAAATSCVKLNFQNKEAQDSNCFNNRMRDRHFFYDSTR